MDGIDYLNPSRIPQTYFVNLPDPEKIPIPKNAEDIVLGYERLLDLVNKNYVKLDELAILQRFCLDNANENPEINYISIKPGEELKFKKIFFKEINKLINNEVARLTSCKEEV